MKKPIPVILDTDLGGDIDDTWALAMLLNSPELDVKMIISAASDTIYQARLIAKLLEIAGRTDIPIGVGIPEETDLYHQKKWLGNYKLKDYPGTIHRDGISAMIDLIITSPQPITLICISPTLNLGVALQREPRIAHNARFVGMHGSIYKGYDNADQISAECNVVWHTPHCQKTFTAPWDMCITPLDTCGIIQLDGERYQKILQCQDPLIQALIQSYKMWIPFEGMTTHPDTQSTILFDTLAIHLAYSQDFLEMETLGIRVTDDGYTLIDPTAKKINVAIRWTDIEAFKDDLIKRLTTRCTT